MSKLKWFFLIICLNCSLGAGSGIAKANGINIWHETFGDEKDPALLLVMGGLCQGILWPTEFCEQLSEAGFYVIRYDHRDSGYSTCFDFKKQPYNLLDMAKDAVGLLDFLKIEKAHVLGLSMGGPIVELLSVHFPKRVLTLTLMASSCDFRPCTLAFEQVYPTDLTLSKPKDAYLKWMHGFVNRAPQTFDEQLQDRVKAWSILNGTITPFEERKYREIHAEFLSRLRYPESMLNHIQAIKNSFEMILEVPSKVRVPTLVIHGTEDPLLPPDHGEALSRAINDSRYVLVQGMGHVLNQQFYDLIVKEVQQHAKTH